MPLNARGLADIVLPSRNTNKTLTYNVKNKWLTSASIPGMGGFILANRIENEKERIEIEIEVIESKID